MCGPNWRKQNLLRGRLHFIDRGIRGIGGIGTGGTFSVIDFRSREFFSSAFTSPSVNPPIRHQQIHHRLTSLSHGFPAFRGAKVQGYIFVRAFGNITKSGSPYSFQPNYSPLTNRMTSIGSCTPSYDGNGNATNDCIHTYTWDAGGQPLTIDSVNLTYDALGRMVEQNRSGAYTQFVYAPTGQKMQIMNGQASVKSIVPLPGGGQAVFTASGQYYYHSDHLGSFRFASTSNRTMYFDQAYAPFGETYAASGATDPAFTTQRQDTVAGLYDFPAREYSIQGRWPSPDPAGLAAVDPTNPQSWNRYAYVLNNPLNSIDPLGLCTEHSIGPACADPDRPLVAGGGGGGGFTDSFTGGCYLNDAEVDCGFLGVVMGSPGGYTAQCPNNNCGPYPANNGTLYSTKLTTDGFAYLNPNNGDTFSGGSELGLPNLDDSGGFPFPTSSGGQGSSGNSGCVVPRVLSIIPGAQPTGTGQNQGGHQQTNFTFSGNLAAFAPMAPNAFLIFGVSNGYRFGGVFFSLHVNSVNFNPITNTTSFQGHEDMFNPATGLFGILGHTVVDLGVGTLFFNHS